MGVSVTTFVAVINQLLPEPHAGLLNGLLFGTKATLTKDLYQHLITTGTLHIVALSGMNITILAGLVSMTLLRVVSRRIAGLLTILLIIGFVWFVGLSPSVIRAAIMGTISLLAVIFGRQTWSILSWILAVSIMLLLNPLWIGDLSFQLSALATLGIILFGKAKNSLAGPDQVDGQKSAGQRIFLSAGALDGSPFAAHPSSRLEAFAGDGRWGTPTKESPCGFSWGKTPDRTRFLNLRVTVLEKTRHLALSALLSALSDDLHVTLAAQVFTIPLIWWYFHRMSLISPLANVMIGWLIAPLTILGWLVAVLGYLFLPLGQLLAWVVWIPLQFLLTVVDVLARVPMASVGW